MRISPSAVVACLAGLLTTGCVSYSVQRVGSNKLKYPAVFYNLPRAVVVVEVPVKRVAVTPGFCSKEDRLAWVKLGIKKEDLPTTEKVSYKLGDFLVGTRTQPDPEQVFAVRVDDDFLVNRVQNLELSDTGFLSGAMTESKSSVEDFTVKTITLAANLAGKAIGGFGAGTPGALPKHEEGEEQRLCGKLAKDILDIRKSRQDLLAGRGQMVSPSKEALEFMDKGLREMEQELLAGFTGSKEIKEVSVRCEFVPTAKEKSGTLLEISAEGRLKPSKNSSCSIPSLVAAAAADPAKSVVTVNVNEDSVQFSTVVEKGQREPSSEEGYFYRIPAAAVVSVAVDSDVRSRAVKLIPQLGTVSFLPGDADISSLATKYELTLHAESGALKTFSGTTTPVSANPVETLGGAANTLVDAVKQKRATESGRELSDLEAERKKLEERFKIMELQGKLSNQATP